MLGFECSKSRENKNVLRFVLKREVYEIERREEGSLFHVRGVCIEKALGWEDERLMRTLFDNDYYLEFKFIQCSLWVLCSVGLNNITDIIGYHMV